MLPGDLTTAIAVNSVVFNSARFVGTALAGVVIKLWGVEAAFGANAASYLTLIWALILIRRSQLPRPRGSGQRGRMLSEMADGFTFVAANQGTKTVLLLMLAMALLVRPVVQLLPGIADRLLASGVDGFAALSAVIGVGAVAGGYWMAQKGG